MLLYLQTNKSFRQTKRLILQYNKYISVFSLPRNESKRMTTWKDKIKWKQAQQQHYIYIFANIYSKRIHYIFVLCYMYDENIYGLQTNEQKYKEIRCGKFCGSFCIAIKRTVVWIRSFQVEWRQQNPLKVARFHSMIVILYLLLNNFSTLISILWLGPNNL